MAGARDDAELLARWRGGDLNAGQSLLRRHYPSVLRYFELNASWAAEDLAQRTFLACVERASEVRDLAAFRAYVMAVARRQLAMYLRSLGRRPGAGHFDDPLPQTRASTLVARHQQQFLLLRALVELPRRPQLLLILCYWEEIPPAAVAAEFGVPSSTIRTRLARARELLRGHMDALAGQEEHTPLDEEGLARLMLSVRGGEAIVAPDLRELDGAQGNGRPRGR